MSRLTNKIFSPFFRVVPCFSLKRQWLVLCWLVLVTISSTYAQFYPVQVTPQLTPPYSLKLSDYNTTTSEKLFVNLLLTDVNEADLQVRLRFSISGNGVNIQSTNFVQNAAPIQLTGGVPLRMVYINFALRFLILLQVELYLIKSVSPFI